MNDDNGGAIATPVTRDRRIGSIDTLRGFALLGILVMNIPFFALSQYGWPDPFITGGSEGADYATWVAQELFFNLKMMAIFSMLFGAGIVIFSDRAAAGGARAGALHYRRLGWLLLIGLIHAYVIWFGDILVPYVMCGAIVFLFRGLPARWLVAMGVAVMSVAALTNTPYGLVIEDARAAMLEAREAEASGAELSDAQLEAIEDWDAEFAEMYPTPGLLEEERLLREEGGIELLLDHAEQTVWWQTFGMLWWGLWRMGGLMLLGMGLHKLGVFDASRSAAFYAAMAIGGYAPGLALVSVGIVTMQRNGFDAASFFTTDSWFNYVGSIGVALGHVGLVMLVCKAGALRWLTGALGAVGRMALTNYLMHSVVCAFIFYWWGLGLWGTMSRSELMLIVLGIWVFQLVASPLWLSRFRFGPMEWVWRSLTYWKLQPMRRAPSA